jgi:hypothetical protein
MSRVVVTVISYPSLDESISQAFPDLASNMRSTGSTALTASFATRPMETAMSSPPNTVESQAPVPLDAVLLRDEIGRRPIRRPDVEAENATYLLLAAELQAGPNRLLQALMDAAVSLCDAGTAGVSLLEPAPDGSMQFRWTTLSGQLSYAINGTTPRTFSPCGVCLDYDRPVLFAHPDHRYTFLQSAGVPFVEALIIPFYVNGTQAGTIWIVSHDRAGRFDMEDVRIMTRLARFTGEAYAVLSHQSGSDADQRS